MKIVPVVVLAALSTNAFGIGLLDGDGTKQAEAFSRIFARFCVKHVANLGALRTALGVARQIPEARANAVLQGKPGGVWAVPETSGQFLLALRSDVDMCMVFALKADDEQVKRRFATMMASPPQPAVGKLLDETNFASAFGEAHSITYEWTIPDDPRKMVFSLTTSAASLAPVQAVGTAAAVAR